MWQIINSSGPKFRYGAAKFLTEKKSSALSHKIAELPGESQAEELADTVAKNHAKSGNEHIYYSIDAIMTALLEKKKLSFLYFDTDLYGNRTYRKSGERYEVNPLGMVYSGDYFYLVCYHDKYGDAANYRIDRMDDVQAEKQKITYNARFVRFDINAYRREIFSMYTGEQREVELLFPKEFAGIARERFGESCRIVSDRDGYIVCTTVQVSKTFFSWLTTFEGKVKILRPAEVKEQFQAFIENITKNLDV